MSIADYLPHRLLINRSLSRASADLRSHIRTYEIEYEQKTEQCSLEIEQAKADKDRAFEQARQSFLHELSKDAEFFQTVRPGLMAYTDLFLRRQCLRRIYEVKMLQKQTLNEYRVFLREQMNLISEEIAILEERKDRLTAQAGIDDIRELIELTGCGLTVSENDNALSLLGQISELAKDYGESDRFAAQALQKLRSLLQERVELLPVIQYVSWTIEQKKQQHRQLYHGDHCRVIEQIRNSGKELKELDQTIKSLNHSLGERAGAVRACWEKPIAQLNAQLDSFYKEKSGLISEVKEAGRQIESMKREGSNDSDTWDRLWRKKKELKAEIEQIGEEILLLKEELDQWHKRRLALYTLCRENHVPLPGNGRASRKENSHDGKN
ncbi:MAG: hypothetical protein NC341_09515 [Blautia sp.]|nr:hypothetical protein [Blautia sp.]MCM1201424.1 hypothetical protein [Bacteroides fragilis]